MKPGKTFFFSAFKYVVPEDYERWFEDLAAAGWHPVKIGQWSSLAMRFEKSEPLKYRYVLDMQSAPSKDYRRLYEEFGWEYVGQMASAHVWRKAYTASRPESFSDRPSREARDRRFIAAAAVSFSIFSLGALALAGGAFSSDLPVSDRLQLGVAAGLFFLLAALLGLVMRTLQKSIDR